MTRSDEHDRRFLRLSRVLAIVGGVTLVSSIVAIVAIGLRPESIPAMIGSAVFLGSNVFFASVRTPARWMYGVQACEIAVIGMIAAASSDPFDYGGLILFVIGIALLAKYGLIKSRSTLVTILAASVLLDAAASHILLDAPVRLTIAMAAVAGGVYAIVYYAFFDEIDSLLTSVRQLQHRVSSTSRGLVQLRNELNNAQHERDEAQRRAGHADVRVRDLERRISEYEASVNRSNLTRYGLSDRELEVLRILVETRGRNRNIATSLGISERTVKCHLYRICNKVGVDTRLELVELFRWNWPLQEPTKGGTLKRN
jgi:DNA-binding CsgD family transcriptional regulator